MARLSSCPVHMLLNFRCPHGFHFAAAGKWRVSLCACMPQHFCPTTACDFAGSIVAGSGLHHLAPHVQVRAAGGRRGEPGEPGESHISVGICIDLGYCGSILACLAADSLISRSIKTGARSRHARSAMNDTMHPCVHCFAPHSPICIVPCHALAHTPRSLWCSRLTWAASSQVGMAGYPACPCATLSLRCPAACQGCTPALPG